MARIGGREGEAYEAGRLAGFMEALEMMTLREASIRLGLDPASLRQAIARGSLKATKLGRDWIVTPKEVERYRKEHRRISTTAEQAEAAIRRLA